MWYNVGMKKKKTKTLSLDEQIIQAIKDQGLSGYRLAKMSGVSQTILSRFLRRERTLTLKTASKLVAAMNLELKPIE